VNGTNDWEENFNEIHLQVKISILQILGRLISSRSANAGTRPVFSSPTAASLLLADRFVLCWLPSPIRSLMLSNQIGSGGEPEPTLEVLPQAEGGPTWLFMDWLNRTDPNNL
jgi:hypothetical protein